jgi:hypothetical protein
MTEAHMTPTSQAEPPATAAAPAPVSVTVYGPGGTKATGHGTTRGEARRAAQAQLHQAAGSSFGGNSPPSEGLGVLGWVLLAEVLLPVWLWPLLIAVALVTGMPFPVVQLDVFPMLYLLTIPPTLALWAAGGALRRRLRRPAPEAAAALTGASSVPNGGAPV